MADDLFERVARWWDRDSLLTEKRAVVSGFVDRDRVSECIWFELTGDERWRIVQAMRGLVRLADELRGVLK